MANSNQIPKLEHGASETALRVLWKFVKNHDSESDVGIGALLSSVLDTPEQIGDADLEEYVPLHCTTLLARNLYIVGTTCHSFSRTTPERFATQNRRTLLCCYPAVWSPQGYALGAHHWRDKIAKTEGTLATGGLYPADQDIAQSSLAFRTPTPEGVLLVTEESV